MTGFPKHFEVEIFRFAQNERKPAKRRSPNKRSLHSVCAANLSVDLPAFFGVQIPEKTLNASIQRLASHEYLSIQPNRRTFLIRTRKFAGYAEPAHAHGGGAAGNLRPYFAS